MNQDTSRTDLNPATLEEASSWLIEFNDGELDAGQRAEFNHWIRRSPEHVRAYLEIAAAWEDSSRLDPHRTRDHKTLIEQALAQSNVVSLGGSLLHASSPERVEEHEEFSAGPARPASTNQTALSPVRRLRRLTLAASVLAVVGGLSAWFFLERNTYSTGVGEQRSIVLRDGSTVQLNALSKLRVDFSDTARTVDLLQGQALFQVTQDAKRPFVVNSDTTRVRAVGTQFDVYRRKSGTTVTVVEGRVAILSAKLPQTAPSTVTPAHTETPAGRRGMERVSVDSGEPHAVQTLFLSAGEQVTVRPTTTPRAIRTNVSHVTAWTQRKLIFDKLPLAEAVAEFNRHNVRRLVIEDRALEGFHVRGTFSATQPERLAQFLEQRFDVRISQSSQEIRISRRSSTLPNE